VRTTTLLADQDQLTPQEFALWQEAVAAVDAVAAGTDTESASKEPLQLLQALVRTHPVTVVNTLSDQG
jgi:hypothetical protein